MEWVTPKLIEGVMTFADRGGLAFTVVILLIFLGLEIKRSYAKDKIIASQAKHNLEFQEKMLVLIGEVKTSMSNSLLLLEMLTRGRK